MVFTRTGKAYPLSFGEIQLTNGRNSRGTPLITLLPASVQGDPNIIATQLLLSEHNNATDLLLITKRGRIKRVPVAEIAHASNRGLTVVKLKDGDELLSANLTQPGEFVILATSGGRLLRFEVNDEQLPVMSRGAQAQPALRLGKQETLVGFVTLNENENFLIFTEQGSAKRIKVTTPRLANRGDIGTQALQFRSQTDSVVGIIPAPRNSQAILVTSQDRLLSLPVTSVKLSGKDGKGDRLAILEPQEQIISLSLSMVFDK
jgi:DNA gyrase subunit A